MSIRQGNKIIAGNVDNTDYTTLLNKPQINSIELSGNKTLEELGIQASGDYATTSELELKANKADTLAGYGITDGLNTSQITNCITKIPQDIKLELNNGALTIKAGSKVYIPNGIGVFDEYTFSSDLIRTKDSSLYDIPVVILLYRQDINFIDFFPTSRVYSGNTAPDTSIYDVWFDTLNNKIKTYLDTVWTETNTSLPFAIGTVSSSSGFTTINQVFNGFGYIGSTVFALPGVEGLIPNGRNADGSLNNIKFTTTNVLLTQFSGDFDAQIVMSGNDIGSYYYSYDDYNNLVRRTDTNEIYNGIILGNVSGKNNILTSLKPKNVFQLIDRNEAEWVSIQGKPSNKYNDLILEASGSNFTVPSNGWLFCNATVSSDNLNNNFLSLTNNSTFMAIQSMSTNTQSTLGHNLYIPCKKNDIITITYSGTLSGSFTRFIYDEGAK